jgi:hypothetical protein
VPCPLCGGLIHPVAGRCKHCKEDLTQFRTGRPQAAATLPALNGARTAVAAQTATPAYIPGTNGHAPAISGAPTAVVPPAHEGSQPILPPRPTGRSMRAQQPRAAWKSWPMLVIGVAVIAIVVAVVIMILPQDRPRAGARKLPPTPAPERMETNPLPPKASQIDPWSQPDRQAAPAPVPPPRQAPPPAPDDPDDLFGGLNGAGGLSGGGGAAAVMLHVVDKVCVKLKDCPDLDQTLISMTCDQLKAFPKPPLPANCPAAQRCLDAVDGMSCNSATGTSPLTVMYQISECTAALTDC